MKKVLIIFCLLLPILSYAASKHPPETAHFVNLNKYLGKWYEIASFPAPFQRGCRCTTAEYSKENKNIKILNSCVRGASQKRDYAKAKAWIVDTIHNSKLKVQFFWPFKSDYWILYVSPNYQYAIVTAGEDRKYLWILARKPKIPEKIYEKLKLLASQKGFDLSKLRKTDQSCFI